jgi:hypothetical protein
LKLKLAVITVFVLGCGAIFAQSGSATFGFADLAGGLYCNYEQIQWDGWDLGGVENVSNCPDAPTNGQIVGSKVAGPQLPTGLVYAYTDILFDEAYGPAQQLLVLTKTKSSNVLKHYGWSAYIGFDGYEFLCNYGYLSAEIPGSTTKQVSSLSVCEAAQESLQTKMIQK